MMYALGLLTGLTIATLIAVVLTRYETTVKRTLNQTQSKLKPKGSIIEPDSSELEDWIKDLKQI